MCKVRVVNLRREKYDVYIGRAGHGEDGYFGNPFPLHREADRASVLEKFRVYFLKRLKKDAQYKRRVLRLKGKTLGCFCKPKSCHGDTIASYLNSRDHKNE